jgi:precorrin-6B methylase 2
MGLLSLILVLALLFLFARWFVGFGVGAPYLPIRKRDLEDAFSLVAISPGDVVVDLGSGDGRVLEACVGRGASVVGYELNPFLVWWSRHKLKRFGPRAVVHRQDLRRADLSRATTIFIFGITELMPTVASMIQKSAKRGTRVVSFAFEVPGMELEGERGIVRTYQKR